MKKKLTIIGLLLVIGILIVGFFIFKKNNQGIINVSVILSTEEDNNDNKGENKGLEDEDEIKTKDKDNERSKNNAKILAQIKDEDFWNKKIEEIVDNAIWGEKGEIQILGYGLLCEEWKEDQQDLSQCEYTVGFSSKVQGNYGTSYTVYENAGFSSSSNGFNYCEAGIGIAMNDIGNGGVFYNDSYSTGINLKVNNDDGTATYYLYSIDCDSGEILNKNKQTIINRNTARDIITKDAGVDEDVVDPILRIGEGIYECDFSYKGHTYDYKISAKDGTIINGGDEIDIGKEEARKIAMDNAGLTRNDLSHWNGDMGWLDEPHIEKIGTGNSALYKVAITTNKDKYYLYDISATDGKILSSRFGEKFVIYDKKGSSNDLTFKVESVYPKKQKYDIKISELKMDNIYEFKDLIYLWVEFEGDKIVDWSVIDKYSNDNLGKKTKKELDELYNFESHYKIKDMDIFMGEKINLSELKENIIYKYSLPKGDYSDIEVVNDLGEDIIVYENREDSRYKDKTIKYIAKPYLKDGYTRGSRAYYYHDGREVLYVMYKKASTEDLLKIIDENEITFLSKYNVGDKISEKDRSYNENYLYNDTHKDLTVLISNEIGSKVETMEVTIKPGKIIHCSEYADSVTILN